MDLTPYTDWIGREICKTDLIPLSALDRLSAILDYPQTPWRAPAQPPLLHWLAFLPDVPQSQMGEDGHPQRGAFYPPLPLPRRMFAGARIDFHAPLPLAEPLTRRSAITGMTSKLGRQGPLVFLTVKHDVIDGQGRPLVSEEQDIVFRGEAESPATPSSQAPEASEVCRWIHPGPALLFRYSAVTFNAHRIHYDRDYAMDIEGYPALVVHGPLIATLLFDHGQRAWPDRPVRRFKFKALRPLFANRPFSLNLAQRPGGLALWASDSEGGVAMDATLEWAG